MALFYSVYCCCNRSIGSGWLDGIEIYGEEIASTS